MSDAPSLTGPVRRAIVVYSLDTVVALLATVVVSVFAARTHVMLFLIAVIPGLLTIAAATAVNGLLTVNESRVARGAGVTRLVRNGMFGGIGFLALAVAASPFDGGIDRNQLLGVLMVMGFMALVGLLTWYSGSVLDHPDVWDRFRPDRRR